MHGAQARLGGPAAKESAVISQVHAHTHLGAQGCCQVGCQLWALRLGTGSLLSTRAFQVRPGTGSLAAALNLHLARLSPTGRLANAITVTKHAPI